MNEVEDGDLAPRASGHYVQSLARGLDVIASFGADNAAMTLTEVAHRTGLSRATARRLLLTLVELGYVRGDGRRFSLTPQVLRLGTAYLSGLGLPQLAQPHLEALSAAVHESASLAVLDGPEIVYVARVATRQIMSVAITVGTRFPAYATSLGRVLLAYLPAQELADHLAAVDLRAITSRTLNTESALQAELDIIGEQGWAVVDQELEMGLRSMAAPVRDNRGDVVAAINISTFVGAGAEPDRTAERIEQLLAAAAAVSSDLAAGDLS